MNLRPKTSHCWMTVVLALCWTSIAKPGTAEEVDSPKAQAARILRETGVTAGLIVHLGCGDGKLTAALGAGEGCVVHGLDPHAKNIAESRKAIDRAGLSGKVSVEEFGGRELPYADELVNLLVAEDPGDVPEGEMMRVLAPRGIAYVKSDGKWTKTVKPWPEGLDEWTHYLHDATGNAVAHDRVVAAPKHLRWVGGPTWSRSHEYDASLSVMVSSRGRLFYIFDEGPTGIIDRRIPDKWTLTARDAFNGVVLWKRDIPNWGWKAWKRADMEETDWSRMQSQRFRFPLSAARRLVAAGDRVFVTLGYEAPLTALDAATGRTVMTYEGTQRTDEIVHEDGRLVLCIRESMDKTDAGAGKRNPARQEAGPAMLVGLEADSGRRLWQTEAALVEPLSLALAGPRVFYHDADAVVCLDAATGQHRWRTPSDAAAGNIWNTNTTLVVYGDVVLCAGRKQLVGLSAADGKVLWKLPGAKGFGVASPPDLFVADGLLWYGREEIHAESITGYDPATGEAARTVALGGLITLGHHARCYRSKATDNYLLLPKRAVEFVDIKGGEHSRHNWVRGGCRYGVLPANGLLYSTPHPCFCYAGVKLGGFMALAPAGGREYGPGDPSQGPGRLQRGPAFADPVAGPPTTGGRESEDWTMYRHDARRSGSTSSVVDCSVRPVWKTQLGGKLTQPIVVAERLFVARVNAAQVRCLDAATGEPVWDYTAGGRIDSSPTYYRGRLIFGSADGSVYCLRASDGSLAWRFRAAPSERRVMADGQIESAWPVPGSVLLMNDTVYFAAGRSSFLDGGMILYALDPVTGEKRYETRLDGPHPDTSTLDENAYAMEGAKSDLLVSDGTLIYLYHNAFNERLEQQPTPVQGEPGVRNLGERDFGRHLFANAGFLDDSWFSRNHWMMGDRWTAFNFTHQSPKAGQLVVFDDVLTFAVKCFSRRNMLSPLFFPETDGYFLVADRTDSRPALVKSDGAGGPEFIPWLPQTGKLQTCWNLGVGFARAEPAAWVQNVPVRIRAMVQTANALFTAGPPDVCDPQDPTGPLEGRQGALLLAFDPRSGEKLFECPLETPPVFDGLVAARGRLFLSTTGGSLIALGAGP